MNDFPEKVQKVLDLWKTKKENYRDAWNNNGGWPAKNVSIEFTFEGKDYVGKDGDVILFRFNV